MVPSLQVDPCGGEFTHLPSLTPHAAKANGQNCQFTETKDAELLLIKHSILQMKQHIFSSTTKQSTDC